MREVATWCGQNKPALEHWSVQSFQGLLSATTEAIYDIPDFRRVWADHFAFLSSPDGRKYDATLTAGLAHYKKTWGDDPQPGDGTEADLLTAHCPEFLQHPYSNSPETCTGCSKKQNASEKRRLLNFVVSNSVWKDGQMCRAEGNPLT
jgi:hypothetical protein